MSKTTTTVNPSTTNIETVKLLPLRKRRHLNIPPVSIPNKQIVHDNVLEECKLKEIYLKEHRSESIASILSLFERNTLILPSNPNTNNSSTNEVQNLNDHYACKILPTKRRNVTQIILFSKDETNDQQQPSSLVATTSEVRTQKSFKDPAENTIIKKPTIEKYCEVVSSEDRQNVINNNSNDLMNTKTKKPLS
ncbi:hypothetical protein ABK040_006654 [Willaertia magna]